jgi:hypothetical protein
MTAVLEWEFLCVLHGEKGKQRCPANYCIPNLESVQSLLIDYFFFYDRGDIKGKSVLAFPQIFKNIYRMIVHTFYSHKDIINKYEEKYHLKERYIFFCEKFKIFKKNTLLFNKNLLK